MKFFEIIPLQYILIYFVLINIMGFVMFWLDKGYAKNNQWRISEKTLLIVALVGGSIGAIVGMNVFRHKTQKIKFSIGLPIILILQITFIIYLCYSIFITS